jgi:hypothetical protein
MRRKEEGNGRFGEGLYPYIVENRPKLVCQIRSVCRCLFLFVSRNTCNVLDVYNCAS